MKKILFGVLLGIIAVYLSAYLFIRLGGMPVATDGEPLPFEKAIARLAIHAKMDPEIHVPSPLPGDEPNLIAGAKVYRAQCEVCHGAQGQPATKIAQGMFPRPPQLLTSKDWVTDDLVGETYWKVKHGIRLTGMPGYGKTLSDPELWQVSLMLSLADKLPAGAQAALRAP